MVFAMSCLCFVCFVCVVLVCVWGALDGRGLPRQGSRPHWAEICPPKTHRSHEASRGESHAVFGRTWAESGWSVFCSSYEASLGEPHAVFGRTRAEPGWSELCTAEVGSRFHSNCTGQDGCCNTCFVDKMYWIVALSLVGIELSVLGVCCGRCCFPLSLVGRVD